MKPLAKAASVGAVALATAAGAVALPASASSSKAASAWTVSDPIASGLVGPLQIDVGSQGQVYVGQAFAGILTKVRPNGTTKDLVTEPNGVAGVASRGYNVAYTASFGTEKNPVALLKRRFANGTVRTVANLGRFEKRRNPDAVNWYGFRNLSKKCAAQVPAEVPGATPYQGQVDSNPYAVANAPDGGWYVADAGGNDILKVSRSGRISVVRVIRPQKYVVTAEAAQANGLPDCTVGKTYAFEPVPTDVEVNRRGYLIVSLLPGGPEDASAGARGAVMRIDPSDGEFTMLAKGFLGAANVAVASHGRIFVSELFGNRISMLRHGTITPVADVASPSGLEWSRGRLYASVDVSGAGSIVTVSR